MRGGGVPVHYPTVYFPIFPRWWNGYNFNPIHPINPINTINPYSGMYFYVFYKYFAPGRCPQGLFSLKNEGIYVYLSIFMYF